MSAKSPIASKIVRLEFERPLDVPGLEWLGPIRRIYPGLPAGVHEGVEVLYPEVTRKGTSFVIGKRVYQPHTVLFVDEA